MTAGLIIIGIIFEVILLFTIGDLMLYGDEEPGDVYRPIEMNTYRNGDSVNPPIQPLQVAPEPEPEPENQTAALLQNYLQSIPPPQQQRVSPAASEVTYAQIQRHNAETGGSQLDFRLQTTRTDENSSIASDYRSTTSNGYANFQPYNRNISNRPQSPETSF